MCGELNARVRGFTLVELLIVITIMAVISSIAVPFYQSALETARTVKAKQELRIISMSIDEFRSVQGGVLPEYLEDVGHGGRNDPWGNPYGYLNFASGTGNGMEWAIEEGLVDSSIFGAVTTTATDTGGVSKGKGKAYGKAKAYGQAKAKGKGQPFTLVQPGSDKSTILAEVTRVRRQDSCLFPINSDYDLFSLGRNGKAGLSLSQSFSLDDVIRANDGGYFGVASDY